AGRREHFVQTRVMAAKRITRSPDNSSPQLACRIESAEARVGCRVLDDQDRFGTGAAGTPSEDRGQRLASQNGQAQPPPEQAALLAQLVQTLLVAEDLQ